MEDLSGVEHAHDVASIQDASTQISFFEVVVKLLVEATEVEQTLGASDEVATRCIGKGLSGGAFAESNERRGIDGGCVSSVGATPIPHLVGVAGVVIDRPANCEHFLVFEFSKQVLEPPLSGICVVIDKRHEFATSHAQGHVSRLREIAIGISN